jgi:hypothetical protein
MAHGSEIAGPAKPRHRRQLGIRLQTLMVLILVLACALGMYIRSARVQNMAVAAIRAAGGTVAYDRDWDENSTPRPNRVGKRRAPRWLTALLPIDYVANVVSVAWESPWSSSRPNGANQIDDRVLEHVAKLHRLESLRLESPAVTNASLAHLTGLKRLAILHLNDTLVDDVGLAQLKAMSRLSTLDLAGSRVTDDGVLDLEDASRGLLWVYRDEDRDVRTQMILTRARANLDFVRSQPVRLACLLLLHRIHTMADYDSQKAEFVATVEAVCDLEADDKVSLIRLAEARSQCRAILAFAIPTALPNSERERLRRRCEDRGIAALTRAAELGYKRRHRQGGEPWSLRLWDLRFHPEFSKLIKRMCVNHAGAD